MTAEILLQTLASGVLIGLIYALVAIGLTMIFGVMDIVNFAHGEFLMLGMYSSFWLFALFALDPLVTLPLTVLMLFAFGVLLYKPGDQAHHRRAAAEPDLHHLRPDDPVARPGAVLLEAGLPHDRELARSAAACTWPASSSGGRRSSRASARSSSRSSSGGSCTRTKLGAALEATASDKEAARLMGIDSHKMFALAWGIGAACAGAAGALLSTFFPIFPEVGANFILIAFVVVNLGGFGSVAGAFWAGILVGVIEVMGGLLLGPQYKMAIVLALFLAVLMFRPQGLMGKA